MHRRTRAPIASPLNALYTPKRSTALLDEYVFMPTLTIDGRSITVPEGSTILDAARAMAIDVPTLCWYPKLPVVGNCRICLVQVEGSPKLIASCATAAADGMRVHTESDDARKNRQAVLSMLLERYPAED